MEVVRLDELRLIKRIQRTGDRMAADQLIRLYYDPIYSFIKKQVNAPELALDLTQEIFISCFRTITHFDCKKGACFKTWLFKIASNKLVDYFRSRAYHETIKTLPLEEIEPIAEADFVKSFEDGEFTRKVCGYVGSMPPETQKIFHLHIFGEYTFAEIAETVGLPESSVKSRYYRLINLLRKEFSDYE